MQLTIACSALSPRIGPLPEKIYRSSRVAVFFVGFPFFTRLPVRLALSHPLLTLYLVFYRLYSLRERISLLYRTPKLLIDSFHTKLKSQKVNMRSTLLLSALAAAEGVLAIQAGPAVNPTVPGAFIFEFEAGHVSQLSPQAQTTCICLQTLKAD